MWVTAGNAHRHDGDEVDIELKKKKGGRWLGRPKGQTDNSSPYSSGNSFGFLHFSLLILHRVIKIFDYFHYLLSGKDACCNFFISYYHIIS
jgi:hypothetical protein